MDSSAGAVRTVSGIAEKSIVSQVTWITAFAVLTAAAGRFEIPAQPVPFTLQTLAVLLTGAFLGARNGLISQSLYLGAGCLGVPVFAAGKIGLPVLLGPTGGYLLGFPLAASIVGWLVSIRKGAAWNFFAFSVGLAVVFSLGTLQLNLVYFHNLPDSLRAGLLIFSWWDILKLVAATVIFTVYRRGSVA